MQYYKVKITETLTKEVIVAAENAEIAHQIVSDAYYAGEIELTYEDYEECWLSVAAPANDKDITYYGIWEEK